MTSKQYLKLHPEKYVIGTLGDTPIYISPSMMRVAVTYDIKAAEVFSSLDFGNENKLDYFKTATGYKNLQFIKL
jgi:hypothetical protein